MSVVSARQLRRNGTRAPRAQQRQAADGEANGRMLERESLGGIVCSICDESSWEKVETGAAVFTPSTDPLPITLWYGSGPVQSGDCRFAYLLILSPYNPQSISTTFKPSPLGFGSPPSVRNSPFRRGDSPASPSPLRHITPTSSPTKPATTPNGTSRFARPTTPTNPDDLHETKEREKTPIMTTPTKTSPPSWKTTSRLTVGGSLGGSNALSQLQPTQVRTLRDGFQILDRDCDGVVNREDVADMLGQLGLPSGSSDIGRFFPPSKPQTITLAAFLNSLAESLALLSPNTELLSAFSAFDEDDSGQIDWAELRDALLNTPPEAGQSALSTAEVDKVVEGFTGRRAFNRNMNAHLSARRGDVFKYQEFVHSIMGSNGGSEGGSHEGGEE
ncbi:hypothetical protein ACHAQJ_001422 [Trichoderma viride]